LAVEPLRLLAVDRDAVAPKQGVQTPIGEPPTFLRQLAPPRPQVAIICPARAIPHALAIRPDYHARRRSLSSNGGVVRHEQPTNIAPAVPESVMDALTPRREERRRAEVVC
jgi:hypothetical protein